MMAVSQLLPSVKLYVLTHCLKLFGGGYTSLEAQVILRS
jgi:hypothetical protein